jgi:hypothetical protein
MTLPNDIARCAGVGDDDDGWREGCERCARRLAGGGGERTPWMMPPPVLAFECEFLIEVIE